MSYSDWKSKVDAILSELNISAGELARNIDINPRYIYEIRSGKTKNPGASFLQKLTEIGINPVWLLTGEGEILKRDEYIKEDNRALTEEIGGVMIYSVKGKSVIPTRVNENIPEGTVFVPLYSQRVSAGPGELPTQLEPVEQAIPIMTSIIEHRKPENCGIAKVVGDSMADINLFNGDYVLFDITEKTGDGIYVITMFGETRVKRLHYRLSDKKIVISSENKKRYPEPEIVPFSFLENEQLIVHGRVFAWFHKHPY